MDFEAPLWRYPGPAGWHFITLPPELSDELRARTAGSRTGFGSIRVRATTGGVSWDTSVFPDAASGSYLLPVKKAVRAAAGLDEGAMVRIGLVLPGED